jgi:hypothetical protein
VDDRSQPHWRYELTGELDDDDEIVDIFSNDITELDQERREANTL